MTLFNWRSAAAAFAAAAALGSAPTSFAQQIADAGLLRSELVAATDAAAPGSVVWVALRQHVAPGWHTYWRNPGASGQATALTWQLPTDWRAGSIVWPAPERFELGGLMSYVLSGDVLLSVPLHVPATARIGETVTLRATATAILCRDVCVPNRVDLVLPIVVGAQSTPTAEAVLIEAARSRAIATPTLTGVSEREGDDLVVVIARLLPTEGDVYLFADHPGEIDPNKAQRIVAEPEGLVLRLPLLQGYSGNGLSGLLTIGERHFQVSAPAGELPEWARAQAPPVSADAIIEFGVALGLAFLGGLILNAMPCVFPIVSLKAAALARHAADVGRARREALAFLCGTVAMFLALAGLLLLLRGAGAQLGWGFQLQSPWVVAALALVMLASGLNLSGVFEAGLSLQNVTAPGGASQGVLAAFLTGSLAAIVAAPCTAPFMGPAIGWALTQPPAFTLPVFASLATGLAAPVVVLSFMPGWGRWLPRSGAWLDHFKKALAFPMYGAAAWLTWVLTLQTDVAGLPGLFAAMLAVAIAAWAWGVAQRGGSRNWRFLAFAFLLVGAPLGAHAAATSNTAPRLEEDWSPERLAQLRAEGHPVFVDFTAAWCITCQVNDRVALSSSNVQAALRRSNAVVLKADWTNADPAITAALAQHGRSGVPLYLLYGRDGEPRILPQMLTADIVVDALDATRRDVGEAPQ